MPLTWALNWDSAFNEWEREYQKGRISMQNGTDNSVLGKFGMAGIQGRGSRCQLQAFWEVLRDCPWGLFWWAEEGLQLNDIIWSVLWEDCNLYSIGREKQWTRGGIESLLCPFVAHFPPYKAFIYWNPIMISYFLLQCSNGELHASNWMRHEVFRLNVLFDCVCLGPFGWD